jgi:hypothetical protein
MPTFSLGHLPVNLTVCLHKMPDAPLPFAPRFRSSLKLKVKNEKLKILLFFNLAPNESEERILIFGTEFKPR